MPLFVRQHLVCDGEGEYYEHHDQRERRSSSKDQAMPSLFAKESDNAKDKCRNNSPKRDLQYGGKDNADNETNPTDLNDPGQLEQISLGPAKNALVWIWRRGRLGGWYYVRTCTIRG